ncbi:hypothetical protein ACWOB6_02990 [Falseniella ignava]
MDIVDAVSALSMLKWFAVLEFPLQVFRIAKYYLRVADVTMQAPCGIYQIQSEKRRAPYKIFANLTELEVYLKKNPDKSWPAISLVLSCLLIRNFLKVR